MQAELLALPQEATIADAIDRVRQLGESLEDLANIFIINSQNQSVGQLSVRKRD